MGQHTTFSNSFAEKIIIRNTEIKYIKKKITKLLKTTIYLTTCFTRSLTQFNYTYVGMKASNRTCALASLPNILITEFIALIEKNQNEAQNETNENN